MFDGSDPQNYILKKIIDTAFATTQNWLKSYVGTFNERLLERKKKKLKVKGDLSFDQIELTTELLREEKLRGNIKMTPVVVDNLKKHIREVRGWAKQLSFAEMQEKRSLASRYVDLDTYLVPTSLHLSGIEKTKRKKLLETVVGNKNHCLILGGPGAGKTTSMKKLCNHLFEGQVADYSRRIPILVKFRDFKNKETKQPIFSFFKQIIPINIEIEGPQEFLGGAEEGFKNVTNQENENKVWINFIDQLAPLIILDGFDETPTGDLKEKVLHELQEITTQLEHAKVIITCRTGEFEYHLDKCQSFEIAPLTDQQIMEFAQKWIDVNNVKQFLLSIGKSPFADTAIKPLSLAHLCEIYTRIGKIPEKPKTVYRKVVGLLLEEWDEQRGVGERMSKHSDFDSQKKSEFLAKLAYYLSTKVSGLTFDLSEIQEIFAEICGDFDLRNRDFKLVMSEVESHTGLFLKVGYDKYEFLHKSLQEFLTAEYLIRLPSLSYVPSKCIRTIPEALAIATCLSSKPSLYFLELVLRVLPVIPLPSFFYDAFISRLILEAPDFESEEYLPIGIIALLSLWTNGGVIDEKQFSHIKPPQSSQMSTANSLWNLGSLKNDMSKIYTYYSTKKSGKGIVYQRTANHEGVNFLLPDAMYLELALPTSWADTKT